MIVEFDFNEITYIRGGRDAGVVFKRKLQNKLVFIEVDAFPIKAKTLSTWVFWLNWSYKNPQARVYRTIHKHSFVVNERVVFEVRARLAKIAFYFKRS